MKRTNDKDDPKDNPLSFRNFLTGKATIPSTHRSTSSQRDRSRNLPDEESELEPDQLIGTNGTSADISSHERRRDNSEPSTDRQANPYSFKRFLQQDTVRPVQSVRGDDNCLMIHGDLPDFVQDHFAATEGAVGGVAGATSSNFDPLPDFALSLDHNGGASAPLPLNSSRGGTPISNTFHRHPHDPGDLIEASAAAESDSHISGRNGTRVLPDFLSDSGVSLPPMNGHMGGDHLIDLPQSSIMTSHTSDIDRIHREKVLLERDLRVCQNELQDKEMQLERLHRRLRDKENREAEETTAMERMLKQVEQNLKEATDRASRAENHNKKLKEEVKSLRVQVHQANLNVSSGGHASSNDRGIGDRARHVGQELAQSAQEAEVLVRQLLTGVKKVQLMSETLQSLDKFSEPQS